jgi:molybdopterin/thiamine biosynthesis adenylyltransferase
VDFDYNEAFGRNFGLLADGDLNVIRTVRIGIGGLGGCGSNHLIALTRMGFERFAIADPDVFELANMNRQAGASLSALGKPKVDVMTELVHGINPNADIITFSEGLNDEVIEEFSTISDIGVNAIDWFRVDLYAPYHNAFLRKEKYSIIGAAPFSFGCALTVMGPGSPTFEEVFKIDPSDSIEDRLRKFTAGMTSEQYAQQYLAPGINTIKNPISSTRIASSASAIYLCTALTAAEVLFIVTGRRPPTLAPRILQMDMFVQALSVHS